MGKVKAWGMEQAEALTQKLFEQGMDWQSAAEQAHETIFGPDIPDNQPEDE